MPSSRSPASRTTAPRAAASLHERIRADIETKIWSGAWKPGHRIPYEHQLMARYGCSRMTVSKAIGALVAEGLIERRRKAGSFVAEPRIHSAVLEIPDMQAAIGARGAIYGYRLLARRRRKAGAGDDPQRFRAGTPLLALRCLHLANGQPFAIEERLLNLAAVPDAAAVDFAAQAPGSWLLQHVPWTEAEHRIAALAADADAAGDLDIAPGSACLSVERWTWRGCDAITYVRQCFPGERYDLVARFSP